MLGILIEATASIAAVISEWSYGNHSKHAPYIGLISQCFWWTFAIYFNMTFIMLLNAFIFVCAICCYPIAASGSTG